MTDTVARPKDLPDFLAPPLKEVVLGVQFSSPKGYQQIHAGRVWELFRAEYPQVQDQISLPPSFEAFGIPHQRSFGPQFQFATGANHDRFWFLRPDGDELIQFQQDRLLHNWRKVGDETNSYPRFEAMIARLSDELSKLELFLSTLAPQTLQINQCEISYINQINIGSSKNSKPSDWLRFLNFGDAGPDDFSMTFREVIRDASNNPLSRFTCETSSTLLPNGDEAILMTLSVRGAPQAPNIDSALEFLASGRQVIVQRFTGLTTDRAHKTWGRTT